MGCVRTELPMNLAEQICEQIRGFGEYGFPESHAASCSARLRRRGSSATTREHSVRPCSTVSPWAFTRRGLSSMMPDGTV